MKYVAAQEVSHANDPLPGSGGSRSNAYHLLATRNGILRAVAERILANFPVPGSRTSRCHLKLASAASTAAHKGEAIRPGDHAIGRRGGRARSCRKPPG